MPGRIQVIEGRGEKEGAHTQFDVTVLSRTSGTLVEAVFGRQSHSLFFFSAPYCLYTGAQSTLQQLYTACKQLASVKVCCCMTFALFTQNMPDADVQDVQMKNVLKAGRNSLLTNMQIHDLVIID